MTSKMTQRSYYAKPSEINRKWFVIDAEGKTLGRLASKISKILQGKHKPTYTPSMDTGDFVIIINAEKIHLTGNKMKNKSYIRHTGYPGGLKELEIKEVLEKHPERVLEHAIKGMLPKTIMGKRMYKKLKVYAGSTHPHEAQKPEILDI